MLYILDTNVFREFFFHLPKKGKYFENIWNAFEQGIEKGTYISVDECYNELERQFSKDTESLKWITEPSRFCEIGTPLFTEPSRFSKFEPCFLLNQIVFAKLEPRFLLNQADSL